MGRTTISVRNLARFVLVHEASLGVSPRDMAGAAERAGAKLRSVLVRAAGLEGFLVLLARAQTLAECGVSMAEVEVTAGGTPAPPRRRPARAGEAPSEEDVLVLAHILGLLVSLIGEALTLGLVCQAWPDVTLDDATFDLACAGEPPAGAAPRKRGRRAAQRSAGWRASRSSVPLQIGTKD